MVIAYHPAANLLLMLRPTGFLVQRLVPTALVLVALPYVHELILFWFRFALVADDSVAAEGRSSWPGPACCSTPVAFLSRHLAGANADWLIAQSTAEWIISKVYRFHIMLWQWLVRLLHPTRVPLTATSDQYPTKEQVITRAPGTTSNRVEKRQNAKSKAGSKGSAKSRGKGKAVRSNSRLMPPEDRKKDDGSEEDHDSDTGEHPEGSRSTEARLMACPYYKMDPIGYYRCVEKHKLYGFNRLKQHIERCHNTTLYPYYCPLCWVKFDDAEARDRHVVSRGCEMIIGPGDFNPDEIARLQNNLPRGLSDRDKWYWMWDEFFAAHPRPESPYVYEGIREPLRLLTGIARRNAASQEFGDWLEVRLRTPSAFWDDVIGQLLTLRHEHTPLSRQSPPLPPPPPPIANAPLMAVTHNNTASPSYAEASNMSFFPQPIWPLEPPILPHELWTQSLQMDTPPAGQAAPEPRNPGSASAGASDGHDYWNMAGRTQSTEETVPDPLPLEEFVNFDDAPEQRHE
ncbi:hypothetical protein CTA2_4564 [Colletotrichum tanaceti]|uniref:C2H2-type domain-containing protein n=1 Tax=Colletotrichum tanaceti TaxID=1306861 RepID=A0A4U6X1N1_9PEZI|nr:hypothetical protein CTA2_4564 [Colletotrichum tanaceti]TKW49268.1 hypothetical protein CTA1_138 [Colletotrichum tanaceti]